MSKGVLRIAIVTVEGVDYNDREISTETGQTLSVYLNNARIDLARADMNNVAADAVRILKTSCQLLLRNPGQIQLRCRKRRTC